MQGKEFVKALAKSKILISILAAIAVVAAVLPVTPEAIATGKETISFAGSGSCPPLNFMEEDGDVIGFDVDAAQEIAD